PSNARLRGREVTPWGSQALGGRPAITNPCRRPGTDPCRRGQTPRLIPTRTAAAAVSLCRVPARRLPAGHLVRRVPTRRVPAQVPPHDFAGTYCWFFAGGFKRSLQHPVIDRVQTTVYPGPRPASPSLGS